MGDMISVFGSQIGPEEIREAQSSLESQWMGIGPKVKEFERLFSERLGLVDAALVDSGSNSLHLAIKLLGLSEGSEIVLPSFTWISCAHAVILNRCVPVFCDVDLATYNVTAETIRPHISSKTGAVMVVHYAGKPVNMAPILDLGFPVIEDAAHAVDSRLDGVACGGIGTVGIYSFDAVKNLASPDGGAVTARDKALVERARLLRYCGIGKSGFEASATKDRWWEYNITDIFPRYLPNDVSAAVALGQLRRLDDLQAIRAKHWATYQAAFDDIDWIVTPCDPQQNERHSYFTYCLRVTSGDRDAFAKYLYERGIYTTLRYHPLHLNPIYKSTVRLPACEQLNEDALSIPLHPRLTDEDVTRVIESVLSYPRHRQ